MSELRLRGGIATAEFLNMAKWHRERAEELRGIARTTTDAEQKTVLLSIAANHDRFCSDN
jgi:hypothetical protein